MPTLYQMMLSKAKKRRLTYLEKASSKGQLSVLRRRKNWRKSLEVNKMEPLPRNAHTRTRTRMICAVFLEKGAPARFSRRNSGHPKPYHQQARKFQKKGIRRTNN